MNSPLRARLAFSVALMLASNATLAALVKVEPDDFSVGTDLSNATVGVSLSTFMSRDGSAFNAPIYATSSGYAPTGDLLFGHQIGSAPAHFAGLLEVRSCLDGTCGNEGQRVFRADFAAPTDFVQIWTTMMAHAADGAELWAYDSLGNRISRCAVHGTSYSVRSTGNMPAPQYLGTDNSPGGECGETIERFDCGDIAVEGYLDCDYRIRLNISRANLDIAFVLWGGVSTDWTTSPVDSLSFTSAESSKRVPEPGTFGLLGLGLGMLGLARRSRFRASA